MSERRDGFPLPKLRSRADFWEWAALQPHDFKKWPHIGLGEFGVGGALGSCAACRWREVLTTERVLSGESGSET